MRLFKSRIISATCWCSPLRFLSFRRIERRRADLRSGNRVVVENLQQKDRFLVLPQREPAEIPFILIAQDEPLGVFFLQA